MLRSIFITPFAKAAAHRVRRTRERLTPRTIEYRRKRQELYWADHNYK